MNHSQHIAYVSALALLSTSLAVLLIVLLVIILLCKNKPTETQETQIPVNKVCARVYPLTNIDAATDGFNRLRILGEGQLGTVYAATMEGGGEQLVAVKRIHPRLVLSNAGFGFSTVLKSLSLAQHPNIVPITGYSEAPGERIIVMELVGMVSLDFYLHQNPDGVSLLDWTRRFRIAAGAARGLEYLHEGVAPNIVHGRFKPSNILIDVKFCARICDYGLSFLAPREKRGHAGYVDDDERGGQGACKESDVYGFGVVLLELLSGRQCERGWLVEWALPLIKQMRFDELLDPRLVIPSDVTHVVRLAKVASACVGNSRRSRPCIGQVVPILNTLENEVCF